MTVLRNKKLSAIVLISALFTLEHKLVALSIFICRLIWTML